MPEMRQCLAILLTLIPLAGTTSSCSPSDAGARCETNSNCAASQFCAAGRCASGGLVHTLLGDKEFRKATFSRQASVLGAKCCRRSYEDTSVEPHVWRYDGDVILWSNDTWQEMGRIELRALENDISTIALSPDGALVAIGVGPDILLCDTGTQALVRTIQAGDSSHLAFSPDGSKLASGGGVWNVADGSLLWELELDGCTIVQEESSHGLAYAGGGQMLAALLHDEATRKRSIKLWQAEDGIEVMDIQAGSSWIHCLTASNDHMAAAAIRSIKLWNVDDGSEMPALGADAHQDDLKAVRISRDGALVASGTSDGEGHIRIWDVRTGEHLATFETGSGVWDLDFSSDRRFIAGASMWESGILIYDIEALE